MFEAIVSGAFQGWSLDILQIQIAEQYRRQGYGLRLFEWLQAHSPTDFIFVGSVTSIEMEAFMNKHQELLQAKQICDGTDWVIPT